MSLVLGILEQVSASVGGGGGYPSIAAVAYNTDNGSTYTANMPTPVTAGDLLIMLLNRTTLGASPSDTPAGWTQIGSSDDIYYKWAIGGETSVTFVDTGSNTTIFTTMRIGGADPAQNPVAEIDSQSDVGTPNPPSIDPPWADAKNLFIAWAGTISPRNLSGAGYPSGYTFYQSEHDESAGTIFIAAKQSLSSALENPGVFTLSSPVSTYVATIAVKGAP